MIGARIALRLGALACVLAACGGGDRAVVDSTTTSVSTTLSPSVPPPTGSQDLGVLDAVIAPGATETRISVGEDCLDVLVADTVEERSRGLSERTSLGRFAGLLFAWDSDVDSAFYMYRTRIPLTIGWYSAGGAPIDRADMEPCPARLAADCPLYEAKGRYRYALEVPSGQLVPGALGACAQ